LKNREKIIVALAGLAALYAAFDLAFPSPKHDPPAFSSADAASILAGVAAQVQSTGGGEAEAAYRILATAQNRWSRNPFADGVFQSADSLRSRKNDLAETAAEALVYSGFVIMGEDHIAIINGLDCKRGDLVEGYLVTAIRPEAVEMQKGETVLTIPFREESNTE